MDPDTLDGAAQTVPEQQLYDVLAACRIHKYANVLGQCGKMLSVVVLHVGS